MSCTTIAVKPHTPSWHAERAKGIGGSDAGAVLGINPWRSPLDVWMEKTGRAEAKDLSDNDRVEWGLLLEDTIAKKYKSCHPAIKLHKPSGIYVRTETTFIRVNPDHIIHHKDGTTAGLEIKTSQSDKEWFTADGTEAIPPYYRAQAIQYLAVIDDMLYVDFAVLIAGHKYFERRIAREDVLDDIAFLIKRETEFWNDYVLADVAPAAIGAGDDAHNLLLLHPEGLTEAVIDDAGILRAIKTYKAATEAISDIEKDKTAALLAIKQWMGDIKTAKSATHKVTWVRSQVSRFDAKRFAAEHPELAAQYTKTEPRDGGLRISEIGE